MTKLKCSGWWEQQGFGRQPMNDLILSFADGKISGTLFDIVGSFFLEGYLELDRIALLKQYVDQHHIDYHGISVGEVVYSGDWSCVGHVGGKWLIGVEKALDADTDWVSEVLEI